MTQKIKNLLYNLSQREDVQNLFGDHEIQWAKNYLTQQWHSSKVKKHLSKLSNKLQDY